MYSSSRAPPPAVAGPPSDRQEYGISTIATPSGGNGLGVDGSAYDYEVKRQRLLHGGSAAAAAAGMLNPFYQGQPLQSIPQISFSSPSNATAAPPVPVLQPTFGSSLNSYYTAASPTPPPQHPGVPVVGSTMYFPHDLHSSGANPNPASNPGSAYNIVSSAGANPNNMNSVSLYSTSANPNPNYVSNAGRSLNPLLNTAYSSPGHLQPFPGAGSSVPILSGASPYRADSPMSMAGNLNHHSAGSPATLPLMPFEQRSPHQTHSPPPSSFKDSGLNPFPAYSRFFPVVRIRGLPFNCSESDVYDFFEGLDVVDVLLTHRQGRFSGEAYCVFGLPMQVDLALHRNRKCMGQRYIEVFRSKKHEYYLAIAAEVSEQEKIPTGELAPSYPLSKSTMDKEHMEHTGVLKLRGLPFSASKKDVIEFFKDFNLKDENIQFVVHSDGRASGEAFVEFDGPVLSKQAMVRDKMMLGSRYIELFPSSSEEASRATGRHKK